MAGRMMLAIAILISLATAMAPPGVGAAPVDLPGDIDHEPFDRLLAAYVDSTGLVDYVAWKANEGDLDALSDYTAQFDAAGLPAEGNQAVASLINAYNALTIQWILEHYPTESIVSLNDSWSQARHPVGGRDVSLDEIEHDTLRPLAGFRVHAVLVCAALSCPPLRPAIYTADSLDVELDDAMRRWLAREDLNQWLPEEGRVKLSAIFKWYAEDFEAAGGLREVLARYAPPGVEELLAGEYEIEHLPYHWGLNDQRGAGASYGKRKAMFDYLKNIFR
jgi:hypothetical protein